MRTMGLGLAVICSALLVGCAPDEMPGPSDGRGLFMQNCAVCHGADARGNGPMARAMARPPADLTLISVRHGDRFPKARVLSIIDGYARSKMEGPGMPEFGQLLEGDEVPVDTGDGIMTPVPRKLAALLEYLESIQAAR